MKFLLRLGYNLGLIGLAVGPLAMWIHYRPALAERHDLSVYVGGLVVSGLWAWALLKASIHQARRRKLYRVIQEAGARPPVIGY